ncbi:MAG: GFA family protein [Woeseia sp.]
MVYKGSCHCGQVAFEAEGELQDVIDCNCSICLRKGALLWAVPRQQFRLLTSTDNLSTYRFNKHAIGHNFCSNCGMHPYAEGKDRSGTEFVMVNARCLEGVDPDSLTVQHFDGRSL